jgi:hypothetical protein
MKEKERIELREKFRKETGDNWENSQGEPDIDYVLWLESKLFATPDVVGQSEQLKAFAEYLDELHGGEDFAVNEIDSFLKSL